MNKVYKISPPHVLLWAQISGNGNTFIYVNEEELYNAKFTWN